MALEVEAEGRYQALTMSQFLSITMLCFHHSYVEDQDKDRLSRSYLLRMFWICWEL